ncbi:MAG: 50S ribosomal protein L21 [Candidatus Nealsonbacteria bacterium]
MLAVIKTGGKQYLVAPKNRIRIEKLEAKEGEEVVFNEILLLEKDDQVQIGTPLVAGAKVFAKILKQGKAKKIIIGKFKAKKRYTLKKGHRQFFTQVEITKIE